MSPASPLLGLIASAGFGEWVVIVVVLLVVYGPRRLPELARKLGRWISQWQNATDAFRRQLMTLDEDDVAPGTNGTPN